MKKLPYQILLLVLLLVSIDIYAQDSKLIAFGIPQNLKENSNVVIRNHDIIVNVTSVDQMIVRERKVITVLNKLGNNYVDAGVGYDDNTKVTKLEAKIYNGLGKEIKKFSKKKFADVSAVDGGTLYSDSRVKYMEYTPITYPYTLVFECEYKTSSTGFIPNWSPVPNYHMSVENSSFSVNYPASLGITIKPKNFAGFVIKNESKEGRLKYVIENAEAIKYESSSPSLNYIRPKLLVSLNTFNTEGVRGEYSNWKEFGQWMKDKILVGKDQVDEATKTKILALTATATTDVEKAKIVYNFVQEKTRYISVQVGIGGIQPIAANQVDKVGYGDCKGLTNYTKALLDVVGVTSYYVHVEADRGDNVSFEKDFASLEQGNHVILNIPNNGDDVWLECTSQIMPFGFLGDFTDNRDVLVVTPEGGVIKRTPAYVNETNLQTTKATIQLDATGSVNATVDILSKGIQYDSKFSIESRSKEELKKYYKSSVWSYNNNLEVSSIHHENNEEAIEFQEKLKVTIQDYASLNQGEYLFRVNAFNRNGFVPKRYRNRKLPLKVTRGYKDVDEYTIKIPEGYMLDVVPKDIALDTKFGVYKVSFQKVDEKTLSYKKELLIKEGLYPKEDYKLYRKFRRSVAKYDNLRIALTKI
ncbi:MAG: DUF3857 domain-containing protein [Flavobacteriaceae bacterium]